jgi:anaerobic carbon-monoxide dehydrogenase, CODH/ACS complex subunit epsilon
MLPRMVRKKVRSEKKMSCEPWQCAEIAATKKANPIQKPEIAVAMIKKAARPLLIVGSNATRTLDGRQTTNRLHHRPRKSIKVPVVATAHMVGEFIKRGYTPSSLHELQWTSATSC